MVLLFATDSKGAMVVKNKISNALRAYIDRAQKEHNVLLKIGIGVSSYPADAKTSSDLLLKARVEIKGVYYGDERRQFPRIICSMDVLPVKDVKSGEKLQTIDISEGGVCISSERAIKKGMKSEFVLEFPKSRGTVKAKAKAVWVEKNDRTKEYRVGFQFSEINTKDRETIKGFIRENQA